MTIIIPVILTIWDLKRYPDTGLGRDITQRNGRQFECQSYESNSTKNFPNVCRNDHFSQSEPDWTFADNRIQILVSININAVREEATICQRKKKLGQMIQGNGPQDSHTAALARIKAQKGGKAGLSMEVLMRLSHSKRLSNASTLIHALKAETGSTDLDSQNIFAIETLLECSLRLVTVEASHILSVLSTTLFKSTHATTLACLAALT